MKAIARQLVSWTLSPTVRQIRAAISNPVDSQHRVLRDLLQTASQTVFGRQHGFSEILKEQDLVSAYQAAVPLHRYDDLRELIARTRRQEADVLWPGVTKHFALSSGTSSASKELPVSPALFQHFARFAKHLIVPQLLERQTFSPLLGFPLSLTGAVESDPDMPGVRIGQISGLAAEYSARRGWAKWRRNTSIPQRVNDIVDVDEKLEQLARFAVTKDVRLLVMMPRLVVRLMDVLLEIHRECKGPVQSIQEIWPNLQWVIGGGQPMAEFQSVIQQRFGETPLNFLEMYGASESMFALVLPPQAVPQADSFNHPPPSPTDGLFLHPHNRVYFEFVKFAEYGNAGAHRCTVAEVETGVEYVIYVSTCSGLWSYSMEDLVVFTGLNPHRLKVIGRCNEILNWQKLQLPGFQLRRVLDEVSAAAKVYPMAFHVSIHSSSIGEAPRWLIEFDHEPPALNDFALLLDSQLQQVNAAYRAARLSRSLAAPTVISIPTSGFNCWIKRSQGVIHAQAKVPVVGHTPAFAEGVLKEIASAHPL